MEKICGFYVSNVHLVTMILPYLKEQLKNNIKIETFFESDLNDIINNILLNLIISEKNKKAILDINWKNNKIKKYSNIEKNIKRLLIENNEIIFLIGGNKKYIKETNNLLNKFFEKNNDKKTKIKIINCYKILEFDDNIKEILEEHKYILNTSGIHKIEEVFEDYKEKTAN